MLTLMSSVRCLASRVVVTAYKGAMVSFIGLGTMKVSHLYSVTLVPACVAKKLLRPVRYGKRSAGYIIQRLDIMLAPKNAISLFASVVTPLFWRSLKRREGLSGKRREGLCFG